ncbi:glycoside hydrolase family 105 protein [Paenibacillus chartarius]|uniref:Glycoside hydrolase family 105 protein n=1 Tax=Paenibacillus chartarius TaxID=747481 RepID=A0ABV6DPR9_9BACL
MADSFMSRYPIVSDMPYQKRRNWNYETGCVLTVCERLWRLTGDQRYFDYIRSNVDIFVREDGTIDTYNLNEYNVDQINQGKALFVLHEQTGEKKYREAIELLMNQMRSHPRTSEGGLWHKKIYPYQMWLDGVYMTSPFLAAYAVAHNEPEWFDDVANEILLMEKRSRDPKTGLLYHGWDESREQLWADKVTGLSSQFWSRAVGWFMMAVVDVLDLLPITHPKRGEIVGIFYRLAEAIVKVQDQESGMWYQVLDQGDRAGNYLEASGSSMFVYALAKGARHGYLGSGELEAARRGFEGLLNRCVSTAPDGGLQLEHICSVAGLGNKPYRYGTYEYYVGEPTRTDDPKGVAPFIMAAMEIEATAKQE